MATTIRVEKPTIQRLKKLKLAKLETYDEIINRLINQQYDENFIKIQQ